MTSAIAAKRIRRLEDEKHTLLSKEDDNCTYTVAQDEEPDVPAYDYAATRTRIAEINDEVLRLRHAVHAFNITTKLEDSDLTIDEALVLIAQLSKEQRVLNYMRMRQPRSRSNNYRYEYRGNSSSSPIYEYTYVNYDIEQVEHDYQVLCDRLADLQLKIDFCNQTITFEVDL